MQRSNALVQVTLVLHIVRALLELHERAVAHGNECIVQLVLTNVPAPNRKRWATSTRVVLGIRPDLQSVDHLREHDLHLQPSHILADTATTTR